MPLSVALALAALPVGVTLLVWATEPLPRVALATPTRPTRAAVLQPSVTPVAAATMFAPIPTPSPTWHFSLPCYPHGVLAQRGCEPTCDSYYGCAPGAH